MPAPLLFVGDIHLGRSPHRLAQADLDPRQLDPAEAWRRVVRHATDAGVQAVVLAGDVVDRDKDRFEAYGHLQRGVKHLVDAGVRVIGVAGNHDHVALPKLAERIPAFTLLGRGGVWERVELDGVDLVGWSFPARHHDSDPLLSPGLDDALAQRRPGVPVVGVLHGDLDAGASPYAPVSRRQLADQPVHAWFLGHIHQPCDLTSARPVGYLGSLVGLDRGETGPRGPWRVDVGPGDRIAARQIPVGPVHWLDVDVDLTGVVLSTTPADAIHTAIEAALTEARRRSSWLAAGDFAAVGCSVSFVGRASRRGAVQAFVRDTERRDLRFSLDAETWVVVHLRDATRPARDLQALSAEQTPLGQLARLVRDLDAGDASPQIAVDAYRRFDPSPWLADPADHPPPDPVTATRAAALSLLDTLLEQRDARTDGAGRVREVS